MPYLPYARQDKAHEAGESISSSILCRLLSTNGCNALYTIDCHFMKGERKTIIEDLIIHNTLVQDRLIVHLDTLVKKPYKIIGPDDGASHLSNGQTMKKTRANEYKQADDGSIHRSIATIDDRHLDISNGTVVIADDMVSTGGTIVRALENIK